MCLKTTLEENAVNKLCRLLYMFTGASPSNEATPKETKPSRNRDRKRKGKKRKKRKEGRKKRKKERVTEPPVTRPAPQQPMKINVRASNYLKNVNSQTY